MRFLAKGKELTHHRWFPRDPSHSNQPDPCWPNLRSLKSNVLSHRLRNKCLWAGTGASTLYKQELSLVTGVNASWAVPLLIPFSSNLAQQVSFRHANYGSSEPALPRCKDCPPVWQHLHVAMTELHEPSSWGPSGHGTYCSPEWRTTSCTPRLHPEAFCHFCNLTITANCMDQARDGDWGQGIHFQNYGLMWHGQ